MERYYSFRTGEKGMQMFHFAVNQQWMFMRLEELYIVRGAVKGPHYESLKMMIYSGHQGDLDMADLIIAQKMKSDEFDI